MDVESIRMVDVESIRMTDVETSRPYGKRVDKKRCTKKIPTFGTTDV